MTLTEQAPTIETTDETIANLPEIDKIQAAAKITHIIEGFDPENYALLTEL